MRVIAVVMLVFAAGCANFERDASDARASWSGATYDQVVLQWGTPVRSTSLADGRDAYTWISEGAVSRGALWPSIGIFGGSGGVGIGTGVASWCAANAPSSSETDGWWNRIGRARPSTAAPSGAPS
jgi:hypothetical protein